MIVDEAGMCPEPQCLVPIIATKAKQVVLIGDHLQLKPIIMCREASELGLNTSLFERYALTNSSKNVQFTMLEEQYRMVNTNLADLSTHKHESLRLAIVSNSVLSFVCHQQFVETTPPPPLCKCCQNFTGIVMVWSLSK